MKTFRRPFMRGLSVLLLLCLALPAGANGEAADAKDFAVALADMTLAQNISFTPQEMKNILAYNGNLKTLPGSKPTPESTNNPTIHVRHMFDTPEIYVNSENVRAASTGASGYAQGEMWEYNMPVNKKALEKLSADFGITQNEVNAALTDAAEIVQGVFLQNPSNSFDANAYLEEKLNQLVRDGYVSPNKNNGVSIQPTTREESKTYKVMYFYNMLLDNLTEAQREALAKTIVALAIKDIQLDKGLSYSFVNGVIQSPASVSGGSVVTEEEEDIPQ